MGLGNPSLTQGLLENLPKLPKMEALTLLCSQEKKSASLRQGCYLGKHPGQESRTEALTRHVETNGELPLNKILQQCKIL